MDRAVPADIEPIRPVGETQDQFEEPGRNLVITGWGDINEEPGTTIQPDRMRKATVPVVSDREAEAAYKGEAFEFVPRLMVAAGTDEQDTCFGDSGGPLFDRTDAGTFIQVGITSFGPSSGECASPTHPGVYTEVNEPDIRNFIRVASNM